eukprot:m.161344 g.161344  ORF g.161344 m.161344 type:complete len:218 (+) comp38816_c0_seq3:202-855(+)
MDDGKSLSVIESHFGALFTDLKTNRVLFDDLLGKAEKLGKAVEAAAFASHGFIDAIQKVADAATGAKGSTRDMGTALIKMCVQQRSIELKITEISREINSDFIQPLSGSIKEWDKTTRKLETEYDKESKKAAKTAKKAFQVTNKRAKETEKKEKKGEDVSESQNKMEAALKTTTENYQKLEEVHQVWMRKLLVEQRTRYSQFIKCFSTVVDTESSLL